VVSKEEMSSTDLTVDHESKRIKYDSASETTAIQEFQVDPQKITLKGATVQLTGHESAIFSISFNPTGEHLASSSADGKICEICIFISLILDSYISL
jgi:WD40 repeat protein